MNAFLDKRLVKLEQIHTPPAEQRERQQFYVNGYGYGDPGDFLINCGHDVRDGDIVRHIIGAAPQGGPLFEPFTDITAEMRAKICERRL
jgi:hypothetical protein